MNYLCGSDDDVVDRDEDQFHEEANESHDDESDSNTERDLREFYSKQGKSKVNIRNLKPSM